MTPKLRFEILQRDNYRCRGCGASADDDVALHVDHIVAIANGGSTVRSNLHTLCAACNLGKGVQSW
jgi:5-methylcytosine-specific restriction endonuclease McrA